MAAPVSSVVTFLGLLTAVCHGQSIEVANNIYDSLTPLGCTQFLAILNKCRENVRLSYTDAVQWTLFAPNDTAFANLPPSKRSEILSMTQQESENYVMGFTLQKVLPTTQFRDNQPEQSRSILRTKLFFMKRARKQGNSASGVAGPTEYYVNGAMVIRPNVPAGQSMIHVIDRVLDIPSDKGVLAYISVKTQPDTDFFNKIMYYVHGEYYDKTVEPFNSYDRITAFIPTKEAIGRIPKEKLDLLRNNPAQLKEVVQMHMIEYQVMYTSFVYHNEGVNNPGRGQLVFRTSSAREAVFVSKGGVTAEIVRGNITCMNGALHFIDTLLGYIYNTAKDEIELNPTTQVFEEILLRSRNDLQQAIVAPSGVTIFIPINQAFSSIPAYTNLLTNQSLINQIIELSMLELGQAYELTGVNGDYTAMRSLTSRYFRRLIKVYSQGNETWIESGYVKARVVRPDVAVTNGFVHFIDAVPGVPSRDVPNTIFCEDWLFKSSLQLAVTGLNDYMRDARVQTVAPCITGGGVRSTANVYDAFTSQANSFTGQQTSSQGRTVNTRRPCGEGRETCFFTVFIPNGTAIDFFENTVYGRELQANVYRWKYVLERHITRQQIYLDQIAKGVERTYEALNGEQVRFRRNTERSTTLYFDGWQANVLHSDLGGTNGVVHIIDRVISVTRDLTRDISSPAGHSASNLWLSLLCFSLWLLLHH